MEKYDEFINSHLERLLNNYIIENRYYESQDKTAENSYGQRIIQTACDLTICVIQMREGGSRYGTKWLQSCLMTRYLFE